ncbi:murein transglycosylase domain-containing protein [Shewanella woodyi]|uniref:murein transglycosylase domain-containing protein n=1 Tax=Shewanella woodyi TaxID=60961 RepID=UPI003749CCCD
MKPTLLLCFTLLLSPLICHAVQLSDYDADVAALLLEYQGDGDVAALLREYQGTTASSAMARPSVLTIKEQGDASTYVDFERGIILIETPDKALLKEAIVQVLLTQIDPKLIDAKTAQDFGLINKGKSLFSGDKYAIIKEKQLSTPGEQSALRIISSSTSSAKTVVSESPYIW